MSRPADRLVAPGLLSLTTVGVLSYLPSFLLVGADAVWLAKVVERGMCSPSLVHPKPIRQLRGLTRCRRSLGRPQRRKPHVLMG